MFRELLIRTSRTELPPTTRVGDNDKIEITHAITVITAIN